MKKLFTAERYYKVDIITTEMTLGSTPNNTEIYSEFIASKAPDAMRIEEEVSRIGVDDSLDKRFTVFPKDEQGNPFMWDFQWMGFFKESCGAMRSIGKNAKDENGKKIKGETQSAGITAHKKVINELIFVYPRQIKMRLPEGGEIGILERPLRAETAQGPRVALAGSETVPPFTEMTFYIHLLDNAYEGAVREWLDYGAEHGLLQWRNGGWGAFVYQMEEVSRDEMFKHMSPQQMIKFMTYDEIKKLLK